MPTPIRRPAPAQPKAVRIQPPLLSPDLEEEELCLGLAQADAEDEPITDCLFTGDCSDDFYKIEILGCRLDHCRLSGRLDRCYIRDTVFDTCDLSNIDLSGAILRRVSFRSCKLLGSKFAEARLDHVLFSDCPMQLTNLTLTSLKNVGFESCNLENGSLQEIKSSGLYFKNCRLTAASLFRTSLRAMDLTTDEISGIQVALDDLKGAVVTPLQACELAGLLGLIVKPSE